MDIRIISKDHDLRVILETVLNGWGLTVRKEDSFRFEIGLDKISVAIMASLAVSGDLKRDEVTTPLEDFVLEVVTESRLERREEFSLLPT